MAELSGAVTISTRVEVEDVASVFKINKKDEIVSHARSSLPVGSTVSPTDFHLGKSSKDAICT